MPAMRAPTRRSVWTPVRSCVTNDDGRAPGLTLATEGLDVGMYRLRFDLEPYFQATYGNDARIGGRPSFYPYAEVNIFVDRDMVRHTVALLGQSCSSLFRCMVVAI